MISYILFLEIYAALEMTYTVVQISGKKMAGWLAYGMLIGPTHAQLPSVCPVLYHTNLEIPPAPCLSWLGSASDS